MLCVHSYIRLCLCVCICLRVFHAVYRREVSCTCVLPARACRVLIRRWTRFQSAAEGMRHGCNSSSHSCAFSVNPESNSKNRNLSHTRSHAPEHMHKLAVTEIAGLCLWVIAAPWVKIKGFSDRRVAHPLAGRRRETERGLWKSYF